MFEIFDINEELLKQGLPSEIQETVLNKVFDMLGLCQKEDLERDREFLRLKKEADKNKERI